MSTLKTSSELQKELSGKLSNFNLQQYYNNKDEFGVFFSENIIAVNELYKDNELRLECIDAMKLSADEFGKKSENLLVKFNKNASIAVPTELVDNVIALQAMLSKIQEQKELKIEQTKAERQNLLTSGTITTGPSTAASNLIQATDMSARRNMLNDLLKGSGKQLPTNTRPVNARASTTVKWTKGEIHQRMNVPYGALVLANFQKDEFESFLAFIEAEGVTSLASNKTIGFGPKVFKEKLLTHLGDKITKVKSIHSNPLLLTPHRALRLASMFGMVNCSISTLALKTIEFAKFMFNTVTLDNFNLFEYEFRRLMLSFEVGAVSVSNTARNYGKLPREYASLLKLKSKTAPTVRKARDLLNNTVDLPIDVKLVNQFDLNTLKLFKKGDITGVTVDIIKAETDKALRAVLANHL